MIVYYDIVLVDDESLLGLRHSQRFKMLSQVVECSTGWAELVPRQTIDFGHYLAASNLRHAFEANIRRRGEGLVLKPDDPYFDFSDSERPIAGVCIKLKKGYIGKIGEIGDFAAVGAGYDATKARSYNIPHLKWTHFYVGCLNNRDEVKRWSATPEFTVIGMVDLNETMLKSVVRSTNPLPVSRKDNPAIKLNISPGMEKYPKLSEVFTNPLVFDLRCFSFDKEGNTGFWSPRFPTVAKVHFDRSWKDTVSFETLQEIAKQERSMPNPEDSQENLEWIRKLEAADPGGRAVDAISQLTATTLPTPSPRRSTQASYHSQCSLSPTANKDRLKMLERSSTMPVLGCKEQVGAKPEIPADGPEITSPLCEKDVETTTNQRDKSRSLSLPDITPPKKRKACPVSMQPPTSPSLSKKPKLRQPLSQVDPNSARCGSQYSPGASSPHAPESEMVNFAFSERSIGETGSKTGPSQTTSEPSNNGSSEQQLSTITPEASGTLQQPKKDSGGGVETSGYCRFKPEGCELCSITILMDPDLGKHPPEQMLSYAKDHSVRPNPDVLLWMREHEESSVAGTQESSKTKRILLVDSLKGVETMQALLKDMEKVRRGLTRTKRDLITVYDWRVLGHISILEDDCIEKKYYDGFSNPWRRWYCGLV